MEEVKFENAYFIKLGEKGKWAEESIAKGIVRIGWKKVFLDDINNANWENVKKVIKQDYTERDKKNGSTQDYEALKRFCDANEEDVLITFYENKMYWCKLVNGPVRQDDVSKFRKTKNGWSCNPINSPDKIFYSNEISGKISKTQAFQGTLCQYKAKEEIDIVNRLINGIQNPFVKEIRKKKGEICKLITNIITDLHWKDCEIITDLIFQQSGWYRVSMSGGSMEFMDFEYVEPINNDRYIVQVKSGAKRSDFLNYQSQFIHKGYRKLFFVSFNPHEDLIDYEPEKDNIMNLCGLKLATLIFDLGLVEWVLKKSF